MNLPELTKSIIAATKTLREENDVKNEDRLAFLGACDKMRAAIETPIDASVRIVFGVGSLKLFDVILSR